jgi:hypothetical protein
MHPVKIDQFSARMIISNALSARELKAIFDRVTVEEEKGCWFYHKDWSYYPQYKGKRLSRLMYAALIGPLIEDREICHTCDRPGCINPNHLFQGTHSDNRNDAIKKGRMKSFIISDIDFDVSKIELDGLREKDGWKKLSRFAI